MDVALFNGEGCALNACIRLMNAERPTLQSTFYNLLYAGLSGKPTPMKRQRPAGRQASLTDYTVKYFDNNARLPAAGPGPDTDQHLAGGCSRGCSRLRLPRRYWFILQGILQPLASHAPHCRPIYSQIVIVDGIVVVRQFIVMRAHSGRWCSTTFDDVVLLRRYNS